MSSGLNLRNGLTNLGALILIGESESTSHCFVAWSYARFPIWDSNNRNNRGILSCPFMPFLALLSAALANPSDQQDLKLLGDVVASLHMAAEGAPAAAKLYDICHTLYQNALKCIEKNRGVASLQTNSTSIQDHDARNSTTNTPNQPQENHHNNPVEQATHNSLSDLYEGVPAFTTNANSQSTLSTSADTREMTMWFEEYFVGNTNFLDLVETDQAQTNWEWANL